MRVCIASNIEADDRSHTRHFYAALMEHHGVTTDREADADWTINDWRPRTGRSIRLYRPDPHAFISDYDVEKLYVADQIALLEEAGTPKGWLGDMRERLFARRGDVSVVPEFDAYDVLALPSVDPFVDMFGDEIAAKILHLPMSVPEWFFHARGATGRPIDTAFLGCRSDYYPLRKLMIKALDRDKTIGFLDLPRMGWGAPDYCVEKFDEHQASYGAALRATKVAPFCGSIFGYAVQKYFEAMACGALVCAPLPRDAELLGFVDGETMVEVNGDNFMDKIREYLANDKERKRITANALELAMDNYTCGASARYFMARLRDIDKGGLPSVERGCI